FTAPRIDPPVITARGLLPLGLARQPHLIAQLGREPAAERDRLVPGDAHHRLVRSVEARVIPIARLGPALGLPGSPAGLTPPAPLTVAAGLDKRTPLRVGDRVARDAESGQFDRALWLFVIVSCRILLRAAEQERACRNLAPCGLQRTYAQPW